MENLVLNKYRLAWKNEKSFQAEKLSENEIFNFMKSVSKIVGQYKRSLLFDICFKGILIVSFLILTILQKDNSFALLTDAFFIFIATFGIIWQILVYKRADRINVAKENLKDFLRANIDFYNDRYLNSIFVSALSATLFFLCGSLYYLHFKYAQIPILKLDDFLVLIIGIILSYGLSAFSQIRQHNYQIKQLEDCLVEIEEDTINESSIKEYKTRRIINMVTIGIALIIGLILLLFLVFGLVI